MIPPVVWAEILGVGPSRQALQNPLSVFRFDSGKIFPRPETVAATRGCFRPFRAVSGEAHGCWWWGVMVERCPGDRVAVGDGGDASTTRRSRGESGEV